MYVRRNVRTHRGKTYTNYLLVESVRTPAGPRQKTICSLGDLGPAPRDVWLDLARKLQQALVESDEQNDSARESAGKRMRARRARAARGRKSAPSRTTVEGEAAMSIDS